MMLAQRGSVADLQALQERGYLFDLKIDGVRCKAVVEDGVVCLMSRQNVTITGCYPEITEALAALYPTGKWVFDGELAVNDERGLPNWPMTHKRAMQSEGRASYWRARLPVKFYVFDVLFARVDTSAQPFYQRRHLLEKESARWRGHPVQTVLHSADGEALWKVVKEHGLEGVIAKRGGSAYRSGRTGDWVKIKSTATASCLVGGYDPGEGSRAGIFGALHLYLLDEGKLKPVGKVGSGFSNAELKTVMQAMHQPPLIVEVEYLDVSPDGQLRQPVFLRLRDDLAVIDCTIDQLTTY